MNCIKCKTAIPAKRAELGYTECIECSSVEKLGCVDIVYHKTGNTIEILPKEQAEIMSKLSKRSSFGTLKSIVGSSGGGPSKRKIEKGCRLSFVGNEIIYENIGQLMMELLQIGNIKKATELIDKSEKSLEISGLQATKLRNILNALTTKPEKDKHTRGFLPTKEEDIVPTEIDSIFKHWKNSKNDK